MKDLLNVRDLDEAKARIVELEDVLCSIRGLAQIGEVYPTAANYRLIQKKCHAALTGHVIKTRKRLRVKSAQVP